MKPQSGALRSGRLGCWHTVESGSGETGFPTCPGPASKPRPGRAEREQGAIRNIFGVAPTGVLIKVCSTTHHFKPARLRAFVRRHTTLSQPRTLAEAVTLHRAAEETNWNLWCPLRDTRADDGDVLGPVSSLPQCPVPMGVAVECQASPYVPSKEPAAC